MGYFFAQDCLSFSYIEFPSVNKTLFSWNVALSTFKWKNKSWTIKYLRSKKDKIESIIRVKNVLRACYETENAVHFFKFLNLKIIQNIHSFYGN